MARRTRTLRKIAVVLAALLMTLPTVLATGTYPDASPVAERISDLFAVILYVALVIGVGVEIVLIWFLWRSKSIQHPPTGEEERGHARLEFAWTVVPALILITIAYLSVSTLEATDTLPEDGPDTIDVTVVGAQWIWRFEYPDGSTSSPDLYVAEGVNVRLTIRSVDVVHSFNVPSLGVKIDAIPNHDNKYWFRATAPGEYHMQCTAFCGISHAYMTGKVVVFPRTEGGALYGEDAAGVSGPSRGEENVPPGPEFTVELRESNCPGDKPWCIVPQEITVNEGDGVHLRVVHVGTNRVPHNLAIGAPYSFKTIDLDERGEETWLNFTASKTTTGATYICAIPGHATNGMTGTLVVNVRP
ncbi:MAG TPA: cytochrome c oxidase subunit II [Candidatus Thermoplasmatota archaeon]|nr:cytochrome c oxidase subunit II [Candidatus Thermoplasmatota archaeon]